MNTHFFLIFQIQISYKNIFFPIFSQQVSAKEQFAPIAKPAKRHYGDVQKVEKPFATLVVFTTNFMG